jgi:hypothetical protein
MAAIGVGSTPVSAAIITMQGVATGAEENPPVAGAGTVQVRFTFNDQTNVLTYSATVNGISASETTAAHIHRGARGVNGPIVHNLSTVPFGSIQGQIALSAADVADLRAGNFYFNAHSVVNPGGFARFQLLLPAAPAPAPAATAPVRAPSAGDGGLVGDSGSNWALPIAAAALIVLTSAGALAFARRHD